jgi:cytochrome c-type biogenesis protein CcmH/NrfF
VIAPLHLGSLHPYEQALTLLLAFGPFVLLAVVVVLRRRQDSRQESQQEAPHAAAASEVPAKRGAQPRSHS